MNACKARTCSHYFKDNGRTLNQYMQEGFTRNDGDGIHWLPSHWTPMPVDESWRDHVIGRRDGVWVDGWYQWEDRPGWWTRLRWEAP